MREDLNRFKTLIDPLVKGGPRVFVKPERVPGVKVNKPQIEKEAPEINRWSVYTVYRWVEEWVRLGPGYRGQRNDIACACEAAFGGCEGRRSTDARTCG